MAANDPWPIERSNAGAIFYNFKCSVERYNLPDTLKAQHIARLTAGFVLYSDMGRVLCSVTGDTVGWGGLVKAYSILRTPGTFPCMILRNSPTVMLSSIGFVAG